MTEAKRDPSTSAGSVHRAKRRSSSSRTKSREDRKPFFSVVTAASGGGIQRSQAKQQRYPRVHVSDSATQSPVPSKVNPRQSCSPPRRVRAKKSCSPLRRVRAKKSRRHASPIRGSVSTSPCRLFPQNLEEKNAIFGLRDRMSQALEKARERCNSPEGRYLDSKEFIY